MNTLFAPGCALLLYNPKLAAAAHAILNSTFGDMAMLRTCCRHHPDVPVGTRIINVCPGCDRRYREENAAASTVSLWEVLAACDRFPFPDYARKRMTIIDACPTRDQDRIHDAIRALASRLNIELIEPTQTRRTSTCCGDILYGELPTRQVVAQMKRKAAEMPSSSTVCHVQRQWSLANGSRDTCSICCSEKKRCQRPTSRMRGIESLTALSRATQSTKHLPRSSAAAQIGHIIHRVALPQANLERSIRSSGEVLRNRARVRLSRRMRRRALGASADSD